MEQKSKNVSPYSNDARNKYVINGITGSLIKLLKSRELSDISISEICQDACVGRTSFYRNFGTKEDVIRKHLYSLLTSWDKQYKATGQDSNAAMYGSLFAHLKENSEFYLLLKKRNLFYLSLDVFLELYGASPEDENMWAYTKSFIAYGTFGWIDEWINRGMQESSEAMAVLLSSHGMQ